MAIEGVFINKKINNVRFDKESSFLYAKIMSSKKEQGFVHLLVLATGLAGILVISSIIPVNRHYNDGKSNVAGVYLAKGDDDSSGRSGENGSSGKSGSSEEDSEDDDSEDSDEDNTSSPEPVRVETKTTPERIKSEIREGNLRVKFEIKDNKVKIETRVKEAEDEVELEDEAEDEAVDQAEAELEDEDIKIATAPGRIALVNKRVGALSNFPISIDPTTRQLTVTTPAGIKVLTVLPQKAIDNMLAAKVMTDVVGEKSDDELASIPSLVKLEVKDGVLVYKAKGTKTHKLLGFIPIKTGVEAFVSAENGQVVESIDSLLGRILNRLTP